MKLGSMQIPAWVSKWLVYKKEFFVFVCVYMLCSLRKKYASKSVMYVFKYQVYSYFSAADV